MMKKVRDADIHLLRVFVAVAECGGFAAAQDRLNVAASTISTQISNLETRLGFRLCRRGRGGFTLTSQGEVVLQSTYKLLHDLGDFVNRLEATKSDLVGVVRISILDDIITNEHARVSDAFRALRANHPYLQFELQRKAPGEVDTALLKRETDVAVSWFSSQLPSLSFEPLFEERQAIFCGAGNPLFERAFGAIAPYELEEADWVKRRYQMPDSMLFSNPPNCTAMASTMEGVAHLIMAGTHIGHLPLHYASRWVDEDLMRPLLQEQFNFDLQMHVATRSDAGSDMRITAVRDAIVSAHAVPSA